MPFPVRQSRSKYELTQSYFEWVERILNMTDVLDHHPSPVYTFHTVYNMIIFGVYYVYSILNWFILVLLHSPERSAN